MIKIVAKNTVKKEHLSLFKEMVQPLIAGSQAEEGCIAYDLFEDISDPTVLTFIEEWTDQAAIDLHGKTPHFTSIVPKLGELTSAPGEVRLYKLV